MHLKFFCYSDLSFILSFWQKVIFVVWTSSIIHLVRTVQGLIMYHVYILWFCKTLALFFLFSIFCVDISRVCHKSRFVLSRYPIAVCIQYDGVWQAVYRAVSWQPDIALRPPATRQTSYMWTHSLLYDWADGAICFFAIFAVKQCPIDYKAIQHKCKEPDF